jgi:hypothetical protein
VDEMFAVYRKGVGIEPDRSEWDHKGGDSD